MKALFSAIIDDEPLPLENDHNAQTLGNRPTTTAPTTAPTAPPASPADEVQHQQVTTTSPQEVTVQVSNGTGTTGLAATAASQLKRNGFNVMAPDDYPNSLQTTTVLFAPATSKPPRRCPPRSATARLSGSPGSARWCRWCSAPTSRR
ncbi:lytR cell envelope-related transcriptional attenuator family protein [Mycobacterium ulcerans str. Harvey]|uniref:LytR cell envelope-related transcriptional attenuator family protein n=1 Tax=Mycobacterium ulcerans str. Harvey TaxID=1299332 RepID=A0ABP3APA2_MYCUL|nr:lytR cell envelope-related transcriptional attenuator family protein [Mycobacterium ulcerans str. Harvey]